MSVAQEAGTVSQDPAAGEVIPPSDSFSPSGMTADGAAAAAVVGDEAPGDGLGSAPPAPSPDAKTAADWRDARIAKLTAQKKELQEQLTRRAGVVPAAAAAPAVALDEAEVDRRATVKAEALAAQAAWDARCVATVEQGKKEFADFDDKIVGLRTVVDDSDPVEAKSYRDLVEIAMDTGEGPKLIHYLGSNPGEAQRIMGLSPVKKAIELARLAAKPSAVPVVASANPLAGDMSQAPKPITTVGRGTGAGVIDPSDVTRSDKLSSKEWFARRAEQAAANFKASDRRTRA